MNNFIAQVVIGLPVDGPFDYLVAEEDRAGIQIGQRVVVPFGRRDMTGYVIGFKDASEHGELKKISRVLDQVPILSTQIIELARWMSRYYGCFLGEAIDTTLPFFIRNRKRLNLISITAGQKKSSKARGALYLIHDDQAGYEAVLFCVQEKLSQGKGVLILAPDSHASEHLAKIFGEKVNGRIARLDAGSSKQQAADWLALKNGECLCALGLRSAVFAPVKNLGLIVMINEDHYGYKEDQAPYYHARDVVMERARIEGSDLLFTCAAPAVELWHRAQEDRYEVRVFSKPDLSPLQVVDLANYKPRKESAMSFPVANEVSRALEQGGKVLVLFNRRGFHTMMKCQECGNVVKCPRCDVALVFMYERKKMFCPSCNLSQEMQNKCSACGHDYLHRYGEGIERVESDLARFFPQARLGRFDRDTKRLPRSADIVVATQAIIKVLDELNVATSVVLDIDAELGRYDFRCHQKVLSLLFTLRKYSRQGVFVQTRQPQHSALVTARSMDMAAFYQDELNARWELGFPPFKHLMVIMLRGKKEETVIEQSDELYEHLVEHPQPDFDVMPPQPDFHPKLRDQYRYTIMGKTAQVENSQKYLKSVFHGFKRKRGVIVTVNVDP